MERPSFPSPSFLTILMFFVAVVIICQFPFADGFKCVQCGPALGKDCGDPLPAPTECRPQLDKGCSVAVSTMNGEEKTTYTCSGIAMEVPYVCVGAGDQKQCMGTCITDGCDPTKNKPDGEKPNGDKPNGDKPSGNNSSSPKTASVNSLVIWLAALGVVLANLFN